MLNRFDHSASKSATTHALHECDAPSGHIHQILNKLQRRLIPYWQNSMDFSDVEKDARRTLTNQSWTSPKDIFEVQRRLSLTFKQKDGYTFHVVKTSNPEKKLHNLYQDLRISMLPGGIKRIRI